MGFFDDMRPPAGQPAPVPPPAAKPQVDQELVGMIEKPKKRGRLGSAAFDFYRSLGDGRTFVQVARQFGVTESAVARFAGRHRWVERIHNESPQRAAEITEAVAIRVKDKVPALLSTSTADAEQARKVKDELLQVGMELVALGQQYLKTVPLSEPKDVLKAIDVGSRLMLQAVETSDEKSGASLVEMMKARLARLQAEPVKDAAFTAKPAEPVKGLDDDDE